MCDTKTGYIDSTQIMKENKNRIKKQFEDPKINNIVIWLPHEC